MTTPKMAKCGMYKYSFCTHKHDACECSSCLLVNRHGKMYKFIEGIKYKKCPHCGEYKPLSEYHTNSNGHKSWCISCSNTYSKEYAKIKKQENKPVIKITEIARGDAIATTKTYSTKEFKEWCKTLLNSESNKKYIIVKI